MFLWTALFLCSLLLQYVSFASPAPALAVHDEGLFQLDGDAVDGGAGDDWDRVYGGTSAADSTQFIVDLVDSQDDDSFTGGSTKDDINTPSWLWKRAKASQAKNDITHAFAAAYTNADNDTIAYFGLNKWEADGNNFVGFWFFQSAFAKTGAGTPPGSPFTGAHTVGDILVLANYTNGGAVADFDVLRWVGSGGNANAAGTLEIVASGVPCTGAPAVDFACGATNGTTVSSPWSFTGRDGTPNTFPPGTFFEGGINLTALGLDTGCFTTFLAETRSSQSVDATLSDFAYGNFSFCAAPDIATQVEQDGQSLGSLGSINNGESVTDHVVVSGDKGVAEGTVRFFVCGPSATTPDCSTGGTQVGGTVTLVAGEADSASFTPSQLGRYCFRVEYTPAAGSKYLAASHTNATTECFQVIPANVTIVKTAGPSPVSAGSPISFTISWGNSGPGAAFGVAISDNLPTTAGLDWSIQSFTGSGSTCAISGPVGAEVLTCNVGTIPGSTATHGTVTLVSGTTAASCGVVNNTGNITSTNDGSGSSGASVTVQCPDIRVIKEPDAGDAGSEISAGDTATFTITVENLGPGAATGVTLTDNLPNGVDWVDDSASCSIAPDIGTQDQVLSCFFGTLASGASVSVTLTGTTDAADCGPLNNTATAAATNEPAGATGNNSDTGRIDVLCAQIDIAKTADDGTVNAGDQIGFTITVTNNGGGTAYGVAASDTLNPAFTWSLAAPVAGWSLDGNLLSFTAASLAPGGSSSVHVVAPTTAAACGVVNNTATVTTTNDGSDSASASVTIQCPDVTVVKDAVASPVSAGDPIAFDITVSNLGPGTAYGVTLSDTLPAGIAWTENSDSCSIAGGILSCSFGDLASGASATVRVSGETDAADCGLVPNTATVAATNEPANALGNNSDDASVVVNCPDLTVVKDAVTTPVSAGDPIAFTITVSNIGTGTARGVTLNDALPDDVAWTDSSASCVITGTGDAQVLSCDFGDLAPGASVSVTITGTTSAANCGLVPNTATAAASNEPAGALGNNSDDATVVVNCPDVTVVKDAVASPVSAGDPIAFDITVSNLGPGTAYGVTLSDTLPAGIAWTENSDSCSIAGGILSCSFGDLASGASATVRVSGETDAADCGLVPNTATVAATNEPANALGNNSDDASVVVNCPDILITKTADDPEVNATDQIGFVITVTNNGSGVARGVTVTDTLPTDPGTSWEIAADSDEGWNIDGGILGYGPADLPAGSSVSVHIVSPTTPATCGLVENLASVTTSNGDEDDDASDVTVLCPDVTVEKTADNSPILAGQTASYTITVTNLGPGTAYGVGLEDELPTGIEWSVDDDRCAIVEGTLGCDFGDLVEDASVTVTVSGVTDAEDCGLLPNTATVDADNEPASAVGNNSDSASITVQCASIAIVKTAGSAADGDVYVTQPGDVVFTYLVTNTGTSTLVSIEVVDDNATPADPSDDVAVDCPRSTLAAGDSMTCTATLPVDFGLRTNVAEVTATPLLDQEGQVSDSDDAVVRVPDLTVDKSFTGNTGGETPGGDPEAMEGDVLTYTLAYVLTDGPVTNGTLTDVIPAGLEYVDGSAADNSEFTFQSYNPATRTLTWTAASVTADDSVTYDVLVADGAAELAQPLTNVVTIDSDETESDSDTDQVYVEAPPQEETATPRITPPPTNAIEGGTSQPGPSLLLVLLALAGLMLTVGFLTPAPARARRRSRRG